MPRLIEMVVEDLSTFVKGTTKRVDEIELKMNALQRKMQEPLLPPTLERVLGRVEQGMSRLTKKISP